jgi:hypothetical protein
MAQQPNSPHAVSADSDHDILPAASALADDAASELLARSAVRPGPGPQVKVRGYAIRQLVVVEVARRLSDVVAENLDHAIQLALAERSRGVLCDLSAVLKGAELVVVEVLATAGRHVRDWPGIPVAVACPDPQVRQALRAHLLGRRLIVTASLLSARTAVLATRTLTVERLRLAAHPRHRVRRGTSSLIPCGTGV